MAATNDEKKLIKRREKYVTERISKAGTHSLEVCIRQGGQTFRKSIRVDEFPSPGAALAFACQLRDETLAKMRAGQRVAGLPTVRQLYTESYEILPVSMKTRSRHDIYFRMCFEPFADTPIDKVTSADIQKCVNKYAETHTRAETGKMLAVWRRIYKTAQMKELAIADKTVGVQLPKGIQPKHRPKAINEEDLNVFCDALLAYNEASISGSYNCQSVYYAIQIMKYCGLRPAETFALTREDVSLEAGTITVNKAVHSTPESWQEVSTTKTEKSARVVPIPNELGPILAECLAWARGDFILARYNGDLWEINDACTLIENVRKKCNVNFSLYMLRHNFSTDLMTAGTPPNVVRDLMGHESSSMSLDYAVSSEEDRRQAVNDRKFTKK